MIARPVLLLAACLACLSQAPPAFAKLPEWAERIAAEAPDLPEGYAPTQTRVLLSDMRYAIQPDGSLKERNRVVVQALRPFSYWKFGRYGTGTTGKVTSARAWHMAPGEKAHRSYQPAVDVAVGDSFLSDQKVRIVPVRGVRRGSIIAFEFEAQDTPWFMSLDHTFAEEGPISLARFEVDVSEGWSLHSRWLRGGGNPPVITGNSHVWELRDVPFIEEEPLAPSAMDLAPMLAVQAYPGEGIAAKPATFASWTDVSLWYDKLIQGTDAVNPQIEAVSRSLAAGPDAGLLERIQSAALHVRDSVRYVAIELGIGGYVPHTAAQTLGLLYGDCKDKGTLFRSLLAVEKIASYPVLVNLTTKDTISAEIPVLGFNHFVVAVPLPPDLEIPPRFLGAVAEGGELGRLLVVDTTDDRTSIGSLSAGLAGKLALVVAGNKGHIIRLPSDASTHLVERRVRVELRANGSQLIARSSRYLGAYAADARSDYLGSAADRETLVRRRVDDIWTGAEMSNYAVEPETDDGSFMETATLQLGPPPGVRGAWELSLFPGAPDDIRRVPLARRSLPVEYGHPFIVRYEVTMKHLPHGTALPRAVLRSGQSWKVESAVRPSGDGFVATLEMTLGKPRFEKDEFAELRLFWSAVSSVAGQTISIPLGDGPGS